MSRQALCGVVLTLTAVLAVGVLSGAAVGASRQAAAMFHAADFQPFANPAQAAKKLTALLPARNGKCAVTNPYLIRCITVYKGFRAVLVFRKLNPYLLRVEVFEAGQDNVSTIDTTSPY